ncbi:hypothetical protein llap_18658 [Limosa lapponica baueri]|uniref:Uncharacterized protein n=1 Tax=Limosa lapponica baueri TaxID=1758121 RepID=A0A2I0TB56_LIMLA|nr:hypothetical protein llap_18658 [Limosa lapponica baueri]
MILKVPFNLEDSVILLFSSRTSSVPGDKSKIPDAVRVLILSIVYTGSWEKPVCDVLPSNSFAVLQARVFWSGTLGVVCT